MKPTKNNGYRIEKFRDESGPWWRVLYGTTPIGIATTREHAERIITLHHARMTGENK